MTLNDPEMDSSHLDPNAFFISKSVQLFVVPLVPLIHYAEGKLLLREIILQILQIHNKASQHTHASAAGCQFDGPSVHPSVFL